MTNRVKRLYWTYRKTGSRGVLRELLTPHNWVGDVVWSVNAYRRKFGRYPNLLAPKRFSEHLLRLKLSRDGRSARRRIITDKELVKHYVQAKLGNGFAPKTLAIFYSRRQALAFKYPDTCVIKPTHMSGEVILRHNTVQQPDLNQIARWFERDYYEVEREANYRRLQPKVIVEELLIEPGLNSPRDYKVFCFSGRPRLIQVDSDRFSGHRRTFYSPEWRQLDFEMLYPRSPEQLARPKKLCEMLEVARQLASEFEFIRIDFYLVGSSVYVGELTNFPEGCHTRFMPDNVDTVVGRFFQDPDLDMRGLLST